jgi:hypothetical protein
MKKLLLILILGVVFTSCQKEYTCECIFYFENGTVGSVTQSTIKAKNKQEALNECKEHEMGSPGTGSNYSICHLK